MSPEQAKKLRAAIRKLVRAEVAYSWKGSGDPADIPTIEKDQIIAQIQVDTMITQLTTKPKEGK